MLKGQNCITEYDRVWQRITEYDRENIYIGSNVRKGFRALGPSDDDVMISQVSWYLTLTDIKSRSPIELWVVIVLSKSCTINFWPKYSNWNNNFLFFQTRLTNGEVWKGNVATFHVVLDPPTGLTHIGNYENLKFRLNINILLVVPLIRSLSFLSWRFSCLAFERHPLRGAQQLGL